MAIDTAAVRSRRALLSGVLGGAAALVAGALGRPLSAQSADGDVIHVGDEVSGFRTTSITASSGTAISGISSDFTGGTGVNGTATATEGGGTGVMGQTYGPDGFGVHGVARAQSGKSFGVFGQAASTEGIGVYGSAWAISGRTFGVYGQSQSAEGRGVTGIAGAPTGNSIGVAGQSVSTEGIGVFGGAIAPSGTSYGVMGRSDSTDGRGGYFVGVAAQVRLQPASSAHPTSGQPGDLFVDSSGGLWFCKGETSWKQLA
jgi:hypothetical protein